MRHLRIDVQATCCVTSNPSPPCFCQHITYKSSWGVKNGGGALSPPPPPAPPQPRDPFRTMKAS